MRTWTTVKEFSDGDSVVSVKRSNDPRPIHSFQVGRREEKGGVSRHFGAFLDRAGQLKVRRSASIARLIVEAEEFILSESEQ